MGGACYKTTAYPLVAHQQNLLILADADARLNGLPAGLARLNTYRAYLATGGYLPSNYAAAANLKYDAYVVTGFNAGGIENPTASAIAPARALLAGFDDVRRTLNAADSWVPLAPRVGSQLPVRFLYPQVEVDRNSAVPTPISCIFVPTLVNQ